jgi:tetratricopeptide (TPR) repeat protein
MIAVILALLSASPALEEYQRANLLFQQQKFAEAGEALDRALQQDPKLVPGWILRGKLAMAFDRFDIAKPAFQRAVALAPEASYSQFMLGFFYYVKNDFASALAALEKAAALDPTDAEPVFYLAMTQEALAHPAEAVHLYERAIELQHRASRPNRDTHVAYARLLFTLGRYEESARQIARVLELDPNSRDGHYEQGRLYFEAGKFAEATCEGEKALQSKSLGTTDRQIHFLLARAYARVGNRERAEAHRNLFEASAPTLRR